MTGEPDSNGSQASQEAKTILINQDATAASEKRKKTYQKPSFEHERIFETMALTCGKISPTHRQCHFNRKNS
jgi:hypothetical protein